jgi:hypothetical protein
VFRETFLIAGVAVDLMMAGEAGRFATGFTFWERLVMDGSFETID